MSNFSYAFPRADAVLTYLYDHSTGVSVLGSLATYLGVHMYATGGGIYPWFMLVVAEEVGYGAIAGFFIGMFLLFKLAIITALRLAHWGDDAIDYVTSRQALWLVAASTGLTFTRLPVDASASDFLSLGLAVMSFSVLLVMGILDRRNSRRTQ